MFEIVLCITLEFCVILNNGYKDWSFLIHCFDSVGLVTGRVSRLYKFFHQQSSKVKQKEPAMKTEMAFL